MIANDPPSDRSDESASTDGTGESTAAVGTVLRNDRRREILLYIAERGGEVDLSALALYLAVGEEETLSAIIEQLHDHHLPRLAAHDLLHHRTSGGITLLIEPDHAEALVARAEGGDG